MKNPLAQSKLTRSLLPLCCVLALLVGLLAAAPNASAQKLPRLIKRNNRLEKLQRRNEQQGGKLAAPQPDSAVEPARDENNRSLEKPTPSAPVTLDDHPLNGVSEAGVAAIFTPEERRMIIRGFGRPAAFIFVLRQLYLTPAQKEGVKAISQRAGNRLVLLQRDHAAIEAQLEEAIYGASVDDKRIAELVEQSNQRQAEIARLRAGIEADVRKLLSKDQLFVYRYLLSEMIVPQRRSPALNPRQQQRQRQLMNQPGANQPNQPEPRDQN
jgi:hypothetical protein